METKPHKLEETRAPYAASAKKPARPVSSADKAGDTGVRYLDEADARKLADQIFSERKNLLHKLAQ